MARPSAASTQVQAQGRLSPLSRLAATLTLSQHEATCRAWNLVLETPQASNGPNADPKL